MHCLLLSLWMTYSTGLSADSMEYNQARLLNQITAKVILAQQTTLRLLDYCAAQYAHLADPASQAKQEWHSRNRLIINKTQAIRDLLFNMIKTQQNPFNAEKYALDMDKLVNVGITQFKNKLAGYPTRQRHYICNRFILSSAKGDRDIAVLQPEVFKQINDFKLP